MRDALGQLAEHLGERYELQGELGRGATATVYKARDTRLNRTVAIKLFDPQVVGTFGAERFVREIALATQLNHPHIVPLLDSGEVAGAPYFIMPCIEGESLRDRLDRDRELPVDEAVQIARDVAVALAYAHERGIVHRDIKPENILLTAGTAVVADFGIARAITEAGAVARMTQTGMALGSVMYMSPEQSLADPSLDGRSDIYSLGATLFEMLAGEPPHTGPTAQSIVAKRLHEPPRSARVVRPGVTQALDKVVQKSLAVSAADRYQHAKAFVDAISRARPRESEPASRVSIATQRVARRRMGAMIGVVLLLALIAGSAWLWRTRPRSEAATAASNSLAVLPFTDLSEKHDQEFFALGMTEELIRALSRLPGVRVTGRTSSFALRGTNDSVQAIGARLKVGLLLTGSIRRSGDSLRIAAELVSTADGQSQWTGNYDRAVSGVFSVQEDIAQGIAQELSLKFDRREALIAPNTKDVAAYQLYLRGRLAFEQRTPASLGQAVEFYKQAVVLDPTFARAWANMAICYTAIARNLFGHPADYLPLARDAALKAVALDSTNAEAHGARGIVANYVDLDWALTDREFRRAIALDSTYADAYYFYGLFLGTMQHADSAVAMERRAVQLEPISGVANMGPGMVLYLAHRSADAVPLLRAAVAANPRFYFTYIWYGLALASSGDSTAGIKAADDAVRLAPGNWLMVVMRGQVLAFAGRRAEARAVAGRAMEESKRTPIASFELARLYALLGDREKALEWIGRSIREQQVQQSQLLTPGFESLKGDPRFVSYLKSMHLDGPNTAPR
ncbi:MAG: protein kinase [Gemmatimonadetes bacterium]|nr:protein kinase [Gemmatimonadota bacterium]